MRSLLYSESIIIIEWKRMSLAYLDIILLIFTAMKIILNKNLLKYIDNIKSWMNTLKTEQIPILLCKLDNSFFLLDHTINYWIINFNILGWLFIWCHFPYGFKFRHYILSFITILQTFLLLINFFEAFWKVLDLLLLLKLKYFQIFINTLLNCLLDLFVMSF